MSKMSVTEYMALSGKSRRVIYKMINDGTLTAYKENRRWMLIVDDTPDEKKRCQSHRKPQFKLRLKQ